MRPRSYPYNIVNKILIGILTLLFTLLLAYGLYIDNLLYILVGLPSVFLLWHVITRLVYFATTKVSFLEDKVCCKNYDVISEVGILLDKKQEIDYKDVQYVYFAEKEIYTVKAIKKRLEKYKINKYETDVRRANLIDKYNVPRDVIRSFLKSKGVRFNENNIVGILLLLEEFAEKYNLPEELLKNIKIDLDNMQNMSNTYFENVLSEYNIKREDMARLRKQIKVMETEIVDALCSTCFSLVGYDELANKSKIDWTLVLANESGTKKAYITHFLDYSLEERKDMLSILKENANPRFLLDLDTLIEHGLEEK